MTIEDKTTLLSLDIGGTQVRAALVRGQEIISKRSATWLSDESADAEANFISDLALDLIHKAESDMSVRAAGVSLAALVDPSGVVISWPNRPNWKGMKFRVLLENRLAMPIVLSDDANATAMAEWMIGAGQGYRNIMVITAGTGIGAGLILSGALFRGHNGWAGELGHQVMNFGGLLCPCGNRGCLQLLASGRALDKAASARGLAFGAAVTGAAEKGEEWAIKETVACAQWLGLATANVANLLDLEAVVVGGALSQLGDPWWSTLDATVNANLLNRGHRRFKLRKAVLPDTAGLLGASILARQMLLGEGSR